MPKRKDASVPVFGSLVRSSSKAFGSVAHSINRVADKTPGVGRVKSAVTSGFGDLGQFIYKVPVLGKLAKGTRQAVTNVTRKVPIVSNAANGLKNAARADKRTRARSNA